MPASGPALAMLDVGAIPPALVALDALAKEAYVDVLARGTVQPGRYLILFGGDVESTQRSHHKAREGCGGALVDEVLLPHADERIAPAILDRTPRWPTTQEGDTLGVLQTASSPTMLRCVDRALKGAWVDLVQLRIADGLGGHAIALLWGETHDVEAALERSDEALARGVSEGYHASIIRNADPEVVMAFESQTSFFGKEG